MKYKTALFVVFFILALGILIFLIMIPKTKVIQQECILDNLKVLDMEVKNYTYCDGCLVITFQNCFDCEHYWNCYEDNHTWYFAKEYELPKHFEIGDYVQMKKCKINDKYYSQEIIKLN